MRNRLIAAACCLLVLPACDGSSGSDLDLRGSVTFGYTGDRTGQFRAESDGRSAILGETAAALRSEPPAEPGIVVMGIDQGTGSDEGDLLMLTLPLLGGPRDLPVDEFCESQDCVGGTLLLDVGVESDAGFFSLVSGTVRVTALSDSRMRGTFTGVARDEFSDAEITVTDGAFDVPLVRSDRYDL